MKEKIYTLETLTCPSCVAKIGGMLKKTDGVKESGSPVQYVQGKGYL